MAMQGPGPETILLVEDDPLVQIVVAEALEDAGFSVVTAETGDEAMQRLSSGFVPLAIVTDIELPGSTNGTQLAWWASRHQADVDVLVISGRQAVNVEDLPHGVLFLAKPFALTQLVASLHAAMSARQVEQV